MWRCDGAVRCRRSVTLIQWTVLLASSLHGVRAIERNRLIRIDSAAPDSVAADSVAARPIIRGPHRRALDAAAGGVLLDAKTKEAVSVDANGDADVSSHVGISRTNNATSIAVFLPHGELALHTPTNVAPSKLHEANTSFQRPDDPLRRPLVRPQSAMQVFSTKSAAEELIALSDKVAPGARHQLDDEQDLIRQEPATAPAAPVAAAPVAAAPVAAAPAGVAAAPAAAPAVAPAAPVPAAAPAVAGAAPAVAAAAPANGTAPVAAAAPADGTAPVAGAAPVAVDEDAGSSWVSWLFVLVFFGGIGGAAFMYWKKKQSSQIRGRLGGAGEDPDAQGFKAKRSTYRKAVLEKGDEDSGSDNSEDDNKATSSAVGAGSEFSRPTSSRNRGAASAAGSAASGGDVKEKDSTGGSQGSRSYKDRRANK